MKEDHMCIGWDCMYNCTKNALKYTPEAPVLGGNKGLLHKRQT